MTPTSFDRSNPLMIVDNRSPLVSARQLQTMLDGIQQQVDRHFFPAWGLRAQLVTKAPTEAAAARAMKITITDETDDPTALGYHFNPNGFPETRVFAKDDMEEGGIAGLSSTLSHEVLEMLADPGVNLVAIGPAVVRRRRRLVLYPYEVCDPVQGNRYEIAGVVVSDFIFPEWFEPERKPGSMTMNQTGSLEAPFTLDANGYASVTTSVTGEKWYDIWGAARKKAPGRHRQRARAAALAAVLEEK